MSPAAIDVDAAVLIIGAGPVGLFIAQRLAKENISVTVLEKEEGLSQLPRASIYYPAVQRAFVKAGIWDSLIKSGGIRITGIEMRPNPVSDGNGGKKMSPLIARMPKEDNLDPYGPPSDAREISMLNMPQPLLAKCLLDECLKLGVQVHFNKDLVSIDDNGSESGIVCVTVGDAVSGDTRQYRSSFLVGSDGASSKTRKLLNIKFQGQSWPEKVVATDVYLRNHEQMPVTTTQILDPVHFAIITPLELPRKGEMTKWRVTFATDPVEVEARGLDAMLQEDNITKMYDRVLGGPRPIEYKIVNVSPYTMHNRLASTLKRGRCLLAGDAAHVNTIIGGMGLSNCMLGADALAEALLMIFHEGKPVDRMLKLYSDERRQVFQLLIDPTTSWYKLRLQANEEDDWFFSSCNDVNSEDYSAYYNRITHFWPTRVRKTAKDW